MLVLGVVAWNVMFPLFPLGSSSFQWEQYQEEEEEEGRYHTTLSQRANTDGTTPLFRLMNDSSVRSQ